MRSAIGLMAGPGEPGGHIGDARLARFGVDGHGEKVFTSEIASAPASSAMCAISAMLVTLGESFTISGRRATRFAVATTSSSERGSLPN